MHDPHFIGEPARIRAICQKVLGPPQDARGLALFGSQQQITANQIGLSPTLMAAANSSGGVMGKMIDAQSIVVASVATGGNPESPSAGTILRAVFWHSIALAVLVGVLVMLQAYVWPGRVPGAR